VPFIFRWVLILILFAFVVYIFKAIARFIFNLRGVARGKIREQMRGRPISGAEMIRCTGCGAFVHSLEAVTISKGKNRRSFCSRECLQSHMRVSA
jgi:hypothetical protein